MGKREVPRAVLWLAVPAYVRFFVDEAGEGLDVAFAGCRFECLHIFDPSSYSDDRLLCFCARRLLCYCVAGES